MRRLLRLLAADRRAVVAIEFAVIAPCMVLLAGGIFTIGSLVRANAAVNRLAMQYAMSFADCSDTSSGVCLTELDEYVTTAAFGNIAPQRSVANLTVTMAQVKMNGSTPAIEYAYPTNLSLSAAQTTALSAGGVGSGQTGVVVTATYQYQVLLFPAVLVPIIGSSVTMSYTVAQLK